MLEKGSSKEMHENQLYGKKNDPTRNRKLKETPYRDTDQSTGSEAGKKGLGDKSKFPKG
jgi:hypothetical protein